MRNLAEIQSNTAFQRESTILQSQNKCIMFPVLHDKTCINYQKNIKNMQLYVSNNRSYVQLDLK